MDKAPASPSDLTEFAAACGGGSASSLEENSSSGHRWKGRKNT